jgi:CRP/FNR family transcriptional regulator, cyclic AMP receptor protein
VELLAGLPAEDVRRVLSRCRRRRFQKGEVIFHEGDPADALHLVVRGRIAIRIATTIGQAATIDFTYEGGMVGEQALLPPAGRRSATAVAIEETETMALSATDFAELRAEHPSVDGVLLAVFVRRQRALSARLAEALSVSAETRVLRRLLDLAATYSSEAGGDIVVPLTQDDLAGLAGTTRETVNRVLGKEAERGILGLSRGRVTVRDRIGLERRAR